MYLSYAGAYGEEIPFDKKYEAEAADYNVLGALEDTAVSTKADIPSYSGSGYADGLDVNPVENGGGIRWIVNADESGLYNVLFRYASAENGSIRVYLDNTNLTYDNYAVSVPAAASEGWETSGTVMFLRKGINIIDIDTDCKAAVDYMRVIRSDEELSAVYEAEDGEGNFKTAFSGDKEYVTEMLAGGEEYLELTVNAPAAGLYKMQVFQSNNDLCGSHSYNIKIIDRYASFEINGDRENAKRYFFPNSFSDDTFLERTVPVELKEGENKIKIYNDDSWHVFWGGTTSEPGTDELVNYTPNFDKFIITPAVIPLTETEFKNPVTVSSTSGGWIYCDKNEAAEGESVKISLLPEGSIKKLTLNGEDITGVLTTEDDTLYTAEITVCGDTELYAEFVPPKSGDYEDPGVVPDEILTVDGKRYKIMSENLFSNGDFKDNSGENMEQWYTGVNKNGHPADGSYQIPKINSDGSLENLVPLTESGLLTTGGYEKDAPDTFYYGADSSKNYLVEHMSSDWHNCAWNGAHSLLAFIPVKTDTKYFFSYSAYSVSGQASVRYGAINMESYVPESYKRNETLNFSGTGFASCNNGDVQNVGGSWKTYETLIDTADGDYFLFNAYWLQMANYLCLGDFRLYELSSEPLTEITALSSLPTIRLTAGDEFTLPPETEAVDENGNGVKLPVTWLNGGGVDTSAEGVYSVTGYVTVPEGYYYGGSMYVTQRIVVAAAGFPASIDELKLNGVKASVKVTALNAVKGVLYAAADDKDGNIVQVKSEAVELKAGESVTAELEFETAPQGIKFMLWGERGMTPLALKQSI